MKLPEDESYFTLLGKVSKLPLLPIGYLTKVAMDKFTTSITLHRRKLMTTPLIYNTEKNINNLKKKQPERI